MMGWTGPAAAKAALLTALALPAWAATNETPHAAATATVRFEHRPPEQVEAGVLQVPENRASPTVRRIGLPWYRLRSTAARPATPIVVLAGGPGASGIDALSRPEGNREIAFYRSIADVVLFDQRGAGRSTPAMDCPQRARYPADIPLDRARIAAVQRGLLEACRAHWQRVGVDLAAYNGIESAADVDELRRALGYRRISLVGGSYGSHLGLQAMRRYPERIERVVFHGIEGPDHTWDDPDAMLEALRRIDAASQRLAPGLGLQIPDGGYLASLARTIARLERQPQRASVQVDGDERTVVVDAPIVRLMARRFGAGGHDDLGAWPRMVLALERGDYRQAARAAWSYRELRLSPPMHWSMDCAAGITASRRARYASSAAIELLGPLNAEYEDLCPAWPVRDVGDPYRAPLVSSIPTLLFHGTWDVSTPLDNAFEVLAGLSGGRLVEVEGGNHGALYNLFERWPPMRSLLRDFLSGKRVAPPTRVPMPWIAGAQKDSHIETTP